MNYSPDKVSNLRSALRDLDELSYDMLEHPRADALCGLIEKLKQYGCDICGHDWVFDQCDYWQHQYCIECGNAKYPDLAKRSCNDLTSAMGKMSEEEFAQSK
jgi:hypothetical protein